MSELETLGYVLSPAKPPVIRASILEDQAGSLSVGDLVAIPIILDDKVLYIFGTVLSIESRRPLLDISSKAPYVLTRGDTMNLLEDVDMLVPSELEDISYVAEIYLHRLLYDKFYGVHVVLPGSKIVRPPEDVISKILPKEGIEIGFLRGYELSLKIPKERLFRDNLIIIGNKRVEIAKKIASSLEAKAKIYVGREDIGWEEAHSLEDLSGEAKYTILDDIIKYLREVKEKTVLILDNASAFGASLWVILGPMIMKPNVATILLSDFMTSTIFGVLRRFSRSFLFLNEHSYDWIKERDKKMRRRDIVLSLAEGEFFFLNSSIGLPIVGTVKV